MGKTSYERLMTERREKLQPYPGALINRGCSRFPSSSDPASGLPASAQHTDHWLFSNPLETENRAPTVTRLICREWRDLTLTDRVCHQAQDKVRWSEIWLVHAHLLLKSHELVFASDRLMKVAFTWSPSPIQGPGKLIVQYYWAVNRTMLHITPLQTTVCWSELNLSGVQRSNCIT